MDLNCLETRNKRSNQKNLNMLNNEINDTLDCLKFEFKHETFKNRLAALEEINKIEILKEQVRNSDFLILNSELLKLLNMKKNILHNIVALESKLGILPIQIEKLFLLSYKKNLVVYVNHALLGFYFCQSYFYSIVRNTKNIQSLLRRLNDCVPF